MTKLTVGIFALALCVSTIETPSSALAADVNDCDDVCTGNCKLLASLNCCSSTTLPQCDGLGPIILENGADLNMDGKSISCFCGTKTCVGGTNNNAECDAPSDCNSGVCQNETGCTECNAAIRIDDSASTVKNLGAPAKIEGPFSTGVDCQNKSNSRVTGIKMENLGENAILNCAKADGNVLIGGDGVAIETTGVANSDYVRDNYIEDWFDTGIEVRSNKDISVDHNMIVMSSRTTQSEFLEGIHILTAFAGNGVEIKSNILHGVGYIEDPNCPLICVFNPIVAATVSQTREDNVCDPAVLACSECIDEGHCRAPATPYALP